MIRNCIRKLDPADIIPDDPRFGNQLKDRFPVAAGFQSVSVEVQIFKTETVSGDYTVETALPHRFQAGFRRMFFGRQDDLPSPLMIPVGMVLHAETETLPSGGKHRIPEGIAEIAEIIAAVVVVDLHSQNARIEIQHLAEKIDRKM